MEQVKREDIYKWLKEDINTIALSVKMLKEEGLLCTDFDDEDHEIELNEFSMKIFSYGYYNFFKVEDDEYIIGDTKDFVYWLANDKIGYYDEFF